MQQASVLTGTDAQTAARTAQELVKQLELLLDKYRKEQDALCEANIKLWSKYQAAQEEIATLRDHLAAADRLTGARVTAHQEQLATIERLTLALDEATRVSSTQASAEAGADEETQVGWYCPATTDHRCGRGDCVGAVCRLMDGALPMTPARAGRAG